MVGSNEARALTRKRIFVLGSWSRDAQQGNAREFLDGLHIKREQLAAVSVGIDEKDYISTIIGSLPFHLANFAAYRGPD